mmetsp:Transcript_12646/g.39067  ORF Transcript_12646/g.39067 Transcript_12646/m.39067 type:complete len:210 (-) Transcript_12646:1034-1663(-)
MYPSGRSTLAAQNSDRILAEELQAIRPVSAKWTRGGSRRRRGCKGSHRTTPSSPFLGPNRLRGRRRSSARSRSERGRVRAARLAGQGRRRDANPRRRRDPRRSGVADPRTMRADPRRRRDAPPSQATAGAQPQHPRSGRRSPNASRRASTPSRGSSGATRSAPHRSTSRRSSSRPWSWRSTAPATATRSTASRPRSTCFASSTSSSTRS